MEFSTKQIISNQYAITRYTLQVSVLISEIYNFKPHIIRSDKFGGRVPNTTKWTGVVGMLQNRVVDLAAHNIAFTTVHLPILDTGFPIFKYRQFFIFRHPKFMSSKKSFFLEPLEMEVWWMIFFTSLCTFLVLFFLNIHEDEQRENSITDALSISMINTVGLLCEQGLSSYDIKSIKGKIVIFLFLILSFLCFEFYSASIVGSLLAPEVRTITTIPKLTKSNLKIVLENDEVSGLIFREVTNPDVVELYENKIKGQEIYVSAEDGIKKVKEGRTALLIYVDYIERVLRTTLTHDELEELQSIPLMPQDFRAFFAFPYQKDSPFSELFRVGVLKIIEVGLKEYHWNKWIYNFEKKSNKNLFSYAVVDSQQTAGIFYVLFGGYFVSLIILLGEILYKILKNKKK